MTKPFKKLLGNRIYLSIPTIPESSLIVPEAVKQSIIESEKSKYQKLSIYAIGDLVTSFVEGDVVLVEPSALTKAPVVHLDKETSVILVSIFDIIMIW